MCEECQKIKDENYVLRNQLAIVHELTKAAPRNGREGDVRTVCDKSEDGGSGVRLSFSRSVDGRGYDIYATHMEVKKLVGSISDAVITLTTGFR